jgi:hypothetical protein
MFVRSIRKEQDLVSALASDANPLAFLGWDIPLFIVGYHGIVFKILFPSPGGPACIVRRHLKLRSQISDLKLRFRFGES